MLFGKSALIAMSGGVDSSVGAYLMITQGYRCEGATMRLYRNSDIGRCEYHNVALRKTSTMPVRLPFSWISHMKS